MFIVFLVLSCALFIYFYSKVNKVERVINKKIKELTLLRIEQRTENTLESNLKANALKEKVDLLYEVLDESGLI